MLRVAETQGPADRLGETRCERGTQATNVTRFNCGTPTTNVTRCEPAAGAVDGDGAATYA